MSIRSEVIEQVGDLPDPPPEAVHVWGRLALAWHLLFGGLALVTAALIGLDRSEPPGTRLTALGCLALLAIWYALFGTSAMGERTTRERAVLVMAVTSILTLVLFMLAPVGAALLLVLYPQIWMALPTRSAILGTVAVDACVTAVAVARSQGDRIAQLGWIIGGALAAVSAVLLGVWITAVVAQSRRRAGALRELTVLRHELDDLSRRAGAAIERDRWIAEVHDTLAQGFAGITLLLEAAQGRLPAADTETRRLVASAHRTAQENLAEARALVAGLTPPVLDGQALSEALGRLVERAGATGPEQIRLEVAGPPRALPVDHEVAVLRIAQEALTNTQRHAHARSVLVRLSHGPQETVLEVTDDGCGLGSGPIGDGVGLASMRMRAGHVGGRLSVGAGDSGGTTVRFVLPGGAA